MKGSTINSFPATKVGLISYEIVLFSCQCLEQNLSIIPIKSYETFRSVLSQGSIADFFPIMKP